MEALPTPLCECCGGPLDSIRTKEVRCAHCLKSPPVFARARAVARYRPSDEDELHTLPSLIRRHKYGLDQALGRAITEFLGPQLPFTADDCDLVIPVPLHRRRLWWRGFNQAALLGAEVARRLERPLDLGTLVRSRATVSQTGRNRDERRRNIRGAFAVKRPRRVADRRILLVDDVMTTGATADECARVMLSAGASRVEVFTLARVL